jgi:hypothetical protein
MNWRPEDPRYLISTTNSTSLRALPAQEDHDQPGQHAEHEPLRAPTTRKLGSKCLLLNLFRKASRSQISLSPLLITAAPSSSPRSNLSHLSPASPPDLSPLANRHRPRVASDTA